MSLPRTILFATSNPHKLDEVRAITSELDIAIEPLDEATAALPEPVEDAPTFTGNALIKARYYAEATGRWCLADDSGLSVDALDGAPGVISARYSGATGERDVVDPANNRKLLDALADVPDEKRTARFVCLMALCDSERTIALARGTVEGRIGYTEKGTNGFGYDPLFIVEGRGVTSAELEPAEKNAISHRGVAVRRLVEVLRQIR